MAIKAKAKRLEEGILKHKTTLRILKAILFFCTGISIVIAGITSIGFIGKFTTVSSIYQAALIIPIFVVTLAWCGYFSLKAVSVMLDKPMGELMTNEKKGVD